MSILSKLTGIGISRKGVKIDPKKALMTALVAGTGGAALAAGGGLGALAGAGSKLGLLKKAGGLLTGGGKSQTDQMLGIEQGPNWSDRFRSIADIGKAGEHIYDRYQENQDRSMANKEYANAQPLRDAAQANLLDTSVPDTSGIFADPNAPQGRYRRVNVGSRGAY